MDDHYRINSPNVVAETLDRETTIVDLEKGVYYALNESGSLIWDELIGGSSRGDVSRAVTNAYGIDGKQAEGVVGRLIDEFVQAGLVVEVGASSQNGATRTQNGASPQPEGVRSYAEPKLSTYTDMQELLLLDPIHEVDDSGWPSRP
jgi:hypothetical protein